jgi:hypothetical protein
MSLLRAREVPRVAKETTVQESSLEGGPPPPEPAAPLNERGLWFGLLKLSTEARQRFSRTFGFLGVLGGVAAIAVVAGRLANSSAFWAAAGSVFFVACAGLVAYAAKGLGIAAETADLLRGRQVSSEPAPQVEEFVRPDKPYEREDSFSGRKDWIYAQELTPEQEEWLAANVLKRDSPDDEAPEAAEVDWIIQNLRRADPPRRQSAREWVRRYVDPVASDAEAPSAADLAWLIQEIRVVGLDDAEGQDDAEDQDQ